MSHQTTRESNPLLNHFRTIVSTYRKFFIIGLIDLWFEPMAVLLEMRMQLAWNVSYSKVYIIRITKVLN